jgi:hypothetical protein
MSVNIRVPVRSLQLLGLELDTEMLHEPVFHLGLKSRIGE